MLEVAMVIVAAARAVTEVAVGKQVAARMDKLEKLILDKFTEYDERLRRLEDKQ